MRDAHPDLHEPAAGTRRDDYGCLDKVYDYDRAEGEQRHLEPACSRLRSHILTRMLRALPGRLWYHIFGYGMSIFNPSTTSGKLEDGRGAQFSLGDRGRCEGPTNGGQSQGAGL